MLQLYTGKFGLTDGFGSKTFEYSARYRIFIELLIFITNK